MFAIFNNKTTHSIFSKNGLFETFYFEKLNELGKPIGFP
jgi:hypothetical protein